MDRQVIHGSRGRGVRICNLCQSWSGICRPRRKSSSVSLSVRANELCWGELCSSSLSPSLAEWALEFLLGAVFSHTARKWPIMPHELQTLPNAGQSLRANDLPAWDVLPQPLHVLCWGLAAEGRDGDCATLGVGRYGTLRAAETCYGIVGTAGRKCTKDSWEASRQRSLSTFDASVGSDADSDKIFD